MKRHRPVVIDGIVHHVDNTESKAFLGRTTCRLFFTRRGKTNPVARTAVWAYGVDIDCMTCIVKTGQRGLLNPAVNIPAELPREPTQINGIVHAVRYEENWLSAGLTLCDIRFTWTGKQFHRSEGHADAEPATRPVDCPTCLRGGER